MDIIKIHNDPKESASNEEQEDLNVLKSECLAWSTRFFEHVISRDQRDELDFVRHCMEAHMCKSRNPPVVKKLSGYLLDKLGGAACASASVFSGDLDFSQVHVVFIRHTSPDRF